jgi:hypothetical protein
LIASLVLAFWLALLAYLGRDQLDYPDDPERDPCQNPSSDTYL